ncbi:MAG: hypothetical protein AAGB19_01495 [Cyanobacteria bacterium P01_F01_bin.3]
MFEYLAESTLSRSPSWTPGDPVPDVIEIQGPCQNGLLLKLLDGMIKESALKTKIKLLEKLGFVKTKILAGRHRHAWYNYGAISEALAEPGLLEGSKSDGSQKDGSISDVSKVKNDVSGPKNNGSRGQKMPATIPTTNPFSTLELDSTPTPPQAGAISLENVQSTSSEESSPEMLTTSSPDESDSGEQQNESDKTEKSSRHPKISNSDCDRFKVAWNERRYAGWSSWRSTSIERRGLLQHFANGCRDAGYDPFEAFADGVERLAGIEYWQKTTDLSLENLLRKNNNFVYKAYERVLDIRENGEPPAVPVADISEASLTKRLAAAAAALNTYGDYFLGSWKVYMTEFYGDRYEHVTSWKQLTEDLDAFRRLVEYAEKQVAQSSEGTAA